MNCECCGADYEVKKNFIAKSCICDEEERFLSFEEWYFRIFKFIGLN
jgi:hypothetical protein